jgi:NitT/TauT family transport system substrate-binding protein
MSVSTLVSGDIQVANSSGGAVASAVVAGANLIMTACYINTLPYELVVQESVKSVEDLRGKSVGISRVGSASDVAARVLIKGLGLEPVKDVPIMQVGGPSERAAAFKTGKIVGFPSPPGTIHLAKGMPHRIMISTADFQKRFDFPYICSTTTKSYLASNRETMRKLTMALIEATHFLKTRKQETMKFIAKYTRQNNPQFLESSWAANVKLHDRVPLVTREGTEVQIKEALARKPGATLRVEDIVDDSIVRELEKSGFIDKVDK